MTKLLVDECLSAELAHTSRSHAILSRFGGLAVGCNGRKAIRWLIRSTARAIGLLKLNQS